MVLLFAVCGPKFSKLSTHIHIDICDQVTELPETTPKNY